MDVLLKKRSTGYLRHIKVDNNLGLTFKHQRDEYMPFLLVGFVDGV